MKLELIIAYFLLAVLTATYLVYTFRFAITFSRNSYFKGRRKIFHSVMIWIFPFFWISILKSFLKLTKGSDEFRDKKGSEAMDDHTTDWVVWAASASSSDKGVESEK